MRALVTGGSGFLGRNLIRSLAAASHPVRAIARSDAAGAAVIAAGAEAFTADLDDVEAMRGAMEGCDVVFHCAASTAEWGTWEEFERINVKGTANVLAAARAAGVRRVVHVSTEAVLLDGGPLIDVDESRPLPVRTLGFYGRSKALAERVALAENRDGLEVVLIRPRFIWGGDDSSLLPKIVDAVKTGRFRWIDGGRPLTSTCHVQNACAATMLAAERGAPGSVYFVTDGPPIQVKTMITALLKSKGVIASEAAVPLWLARPLAAIIEDLWSLFGIRSAPPVHRTPVLLMGQQMTVRDDKARRELGYSEVVTREAGLQAL